MCERPCTSLTTCGMPSTTPSAHCPNSNQASQAADPGHLRHHRAVDPLHRKFHESPVGRLPLAAHHPRPPRLHVLGSKGQTHTPAGGGASQRRGERDPTQQKHYPRYPGQKTHPVRLNLVRSGRGEGETVIARDRTQTELQQDRGQTGPGRQKIGHGTAARWASPSVGATQSANPLQGTEGRWV